MKNYYVIYTFKAVRENRNVTTLFDFETINECKKFVDEIKAHLPNFVDAEIKEN